mgnify:CR=1 FL=1
MAQIFYKDPDAVLDYKFDFTTNCLATSETISSHTVTVDTGITKDSDSESSGVVTVWLSGGTAGNSYDVACKIVTNASRTDERTITIKVADL